MEKWWYLEGMFSSFLIHHFNAQNEIIIGSRMLMGSKMRVPEGFWTAHCSAFKQDLLLDLFFILIKMLLGLKVLALLAVLLLKMQQFMWIHDYWQTLQITTASIALEIQTLV